MIYAPTLYFNEEKLLPIRLAIMEPLGCKHIIIEAAYTHSGMFKGATLSDEYSWMKNVYSELYMEEPTGNAWDAEKGQRDFAKELIEYYGEAHKDDDIIIITDLDEVVFPEAIKDFDLDMGVAALRMDHFSGYLNLLQGEQTWNVGRICSGKHLRDKTLSEIRNAGCEYEITNAGHHYSWLGGVDKMIEKFFSYAHTESIKAELVDPDVLTYKLESGQSLWGEDYWKFVPIDDRFPKYIRDNEKYLTDIGFIKPVK